MLIYEMRTSQKCINIFLVLRFKPRSIPLEQLRSNHNLPKIKIYI
jgi:hypothetical protein